MAYFPADGTLNDPVSPGAGRVLQDFGALLAVVAAGKHALVQELLREAAIGRPELVFSSGQERLACRVVFLAEGSHLTDFDDPSALELRYRVFGGEVG
jgi:hypothetical protein